MVSSVLGGLRLALAALLVVATVAPVMLIALLPFRYRGAKWSHWCATWVARLLNVIFNVRFHCTAPARIRAQRGLIFANHTSYLDIITLVVVAPTRFLSAAEVRRRPVIGWYAAAVDSVFVERSEQHSRRAARHAIGNALRSDPYPPIAIFPEGKLGPGDHLLPFRHGAFEMAIDNQTPYLPCAIRYDRPDLVTWYGGTRNETMLAALWRLARHNGAIHVELIPLEPVQPAADADPAQLAAACQRQIEHALGFAPSPTTIEAGEN